MGKPAARLTDMHMCPMVTPGLPPIPHVGGPITGPGCPTVLIGGLPAAVMGDICVCVGPPDTIILGSAGVFIGGKPAARMGDQCAHGGAIVLGCPTVLIGEISPGSVTPLSVMVSIVSSVDKAGEMSTQAPMKDAMKSVTSNSSVQAAMGSTAAFATKLSRIDSLVKGAEEGAPTVHKHNEEDCKVQYKVTGKGGEAAKNVQYEIKTSDGKVFSGKTGDDGMTQKISGYTEGMCNISFPDLK